MSYELKNTIDYYRRLIEEFITFCSEKGVVLTENNFEFDTYNVFVKKENIVLKLNKDLEIKDNLINWAILKEDFMVDESNPNFLKSKNYALLLHPLFDMLNIYGYTPSLIDVIYDIGANKDFSIAVDLDKIRININEEIDRPLAGWGAKYKREIDNIDNDISHYYHEENYSKKILNLCFSNSYSLDVKWETREDIKTFQAEELKIEDFQINYKNSTFYPARYFHSTYLLQEKYFNHLDGAIHLYNEEEYLMRINNSLNFNKNSTKKIKPLSIKLFKINGKIDLNEWENLTSKFYAGNPYIVEYFEGVFPESTKKLIDRLNKTDPESSSG